MLPYGFYLRAMFYNKKLFEEAGVAEPPKTIDEFMEASKKISAAARQIRLLPARRPGRPQRLGDVRRQHGRRQQLLQRGRHLDHERAKAGSRASTWLVDLYKNGYAPKDSVNWGFNEIVAGFYSGTCAMLDQDPDALIAIAERMKPEDFGVAPMPKGPDGKAFPTIGYAGWSMFAASQNKDLAWKLIATLRRPGRQRRVEQAHRRPADPQVGREGSVLRRASSSRAGSTSSPTRTSVPTVMPTYLEEFAFFKDSMVDQDQPGGAARRHHAARTWPSSGPTT